MDTKTGKKKSSYREPLLLIAFVILGAVLGLTLGERVSFLYPIGQIWLNMLFVLLVPLIFFSISSSIAGIADTKRVGKLLALTIGIFVVTAAVAGIYMFIVTGIFGVDTSIQLGSGEAAAEAAAASMGEQIVNALPMRWQWSKRCGASVMKRPGNGNRGRIWKRPMRKHTVWEAWPPASTASEPPNGTTSCGRPLKRI